MRLGKIVKHFFPFITFVRYHYKQAEVDLMLTQAEAVRLQFRCGLSCLIKKIALNKTLKWGFIFVQ